MAGKQLGKLRQWAGEVIASRDKTAVSEEFRDLEHDIELRRQGLWRLHVASKDYRRALVKKKECEALEGEKLLPVDALGIVMIQHGEEFGDDSAFGMSLVAVGKAHCQIATLQETFAITFGDSYIASIQRAEDEIKEYQAQRKKLDSRRLSYDAAITKVEKMRSSKKEKEKEKKEAEDEYLTAKSRYEETAEDVRARMYAIQEIEVDQLRDLGGFLDLEINLVEQHLAILRDIKAGWIDEATISRMESTRGKKPSLADDSRFSSLRSTKSTSKQSSAPDSSSESDRDEGARPRAKSLSRRKSESTPGSRVPSRPPSRASRKRSDSAATATDATEKEKEREKEKIAKRMSVAGWASSKVGSITGRGKKDKNKEQFSALMDDQDDQSSDEAAETTRPQSALSSSSRVGDEKKGRLRTRSTTSTPSISPKTSMKIMRPQRQEDPSGRKICVALYDFAATSSDELSFKIGDQIAVVNEVLDDWWMGESGGRRGLFPTTYTEVLAPSSSPTKKPPLPPRVGSQKRESGVADAHKSALRSSAGDTGGYVSNSDTDDAFGDHHHASSPGLLKGQYYPESIASSTDDYDENERLVAASADGEDKRKPSLLTTLAPPALVRRATDQGLSTPSAKRPPPPPPPRRSTNNVLATATTMSRSGSLALRSQSSQSSSASSSFITAGIVADDAGRDELTYSPFDSPRDFCREFTQNPFKPKGMCSNCFKMHA